jgi:hypothetical protein
MEHGAVGAVRWWSVSPVISVARFSAEPIDKAILRASSVLKSRARSGGRDASRLLLFMANSLAVLNLMIADDNLMIPAGPMRVSTLREE